ncbi:MAG: nucleoside kinase [Deltaproteobacteria bacterium]|nr:nucleoside kinase [Deltaproteobacteria bacterium]
MARDVEGLIEITLLGKKLHCRPGTRIVEILPARFDSDSRAYLGALVNNRLVSLDAKLWSKAAVTPVTVADPNGASIYRRCATYLLFAAFTELHPELRLEVGQSMGNGYHFRVIGNGGAAPDLEAVALRMREMAQTDIPFERQPLSIDEAHDLFSSRGYDDKLKLLRIWPTSSLHVVSLGKFSDIEHGPVALTTAVIDDFALIRMEPGFVLHFSTKRSPIWREDGPKHSSKLFDTYQETRQWNEILGVNTVGELNELCLSGAVTDIISITEGFHEKKIARIADMVAERRPKVRVILIAGPSSSGKTTFSMRLGVQLRVNGMRPVTVSLDNYYVDRELTPKHPDGSYDFEAIEAIDLGLFNDHLAALLSGKEIRTPKFDFTSGKRANEDKWQPMRLEDDQVLVIEGIHGLNNRLTASVGLELKFRIFVSALTQLVIDRANRVATSDSRLIRRIVRDRRYRGYKAAQTIATWPSVRYGERRNIFPFQDQSDVMFNSALLYEPAVLKVLADRYLLEVPRDHPSAVTAHQLRKFLQLFVPIFPDDVPRTSILREFIGGSYFNY